jgi:2-polyprenyl-3-methyl-5-hydroxy-6-metoxy-1,4-benzoquinol methylase
MIAVEHVLYFSPPTMEIKVQKSYVPALTLSEINSKLDRSDWTTRKQCPACRTSAIKPLVEIRYFKYDRCNDCGFVFANPAPSDRTASEFYNSDFYGNYRILEEETIQKQPYFSISSYTDLHRLAGWLNCEKSARILDFGCGPASFIALLRDEFGFQNVEGLELNEYSAGVAERSYGIKLALAIEQLKHKTYDVIILFEVIEHLTNPDEAISLCNGLLEPGGLLFITTPSVRNIPCRFFPSHCGHYTGPSHVSLFTEEAMSRLLFRFNIKVERLETDNAPLLGNAIVSPIYNLDFVSPRSSNDYSDILFVPNRLGKAFGLNPTRYVRSIPFRVATKAEYLINRFVSGKYSDHLYLLARKQR